MTKRIKRFTCTQRIFHMLLMLSFMVQAATGLARMCIETPWGKALAAFFGGYEGCLEVHKVVGLFMVLLFVAHVIYLLIGVRASKWLGKDSLVPGREDARKFRQHVAWFLGLGKEPGFGRWSYWEKFDYWAVLWGMVIIGTTGLMLYNPVLTSRSFEGWGLNIALWVHRIEALLAIGHVFIIHFFVAHLRRRNFPMDSAIFLGTTPEEHSARERPDWTAEMIAAGAYTEKPHLTFRVVMVHIVGLSMAAIGLLLLIGGVSSLPLITW